MELEELNIAEPLAYQKLFNQFESDHVQQNEESPMDCDTWTTHFTNLNSANRKWDNLVTTTDAAISTPEKQNTFSEIDFVLLNWR